MKLPFVKMTGAGNDFILMDNRTQTLQLKPNQIARLCDRHFGIGSDGLLLVEPSSQENVHWRMRYYNADGGEAEMCGNGARCFARFAQRLMKEHHSEISFETQAGTIHAKLNGEQVTVNMTPPQGLQLNKTIDISSGSQTLHHCNTGVPHAVLFVDDVEQAHVKEWGREIRFHANHAPKGTNVNFVQTIGTDSIRVRTYERGVENETLACGTGVTASAIIAHLVKGVQLPIRVRVQSGRELQVSFQRIGETFQHLTLKGPATFIFEGEIEI